MTTQLILVAVVVAVAVGYLLRQTWRSLRGDHGGCSGCSKSPPPPPSLIASEELMRRFRS